MFPIKHPIPFSPFLLAYIVFPGSHVFYASTETRKIKKESAQITK